MLHRGQRSPSSLVPHRKQTDRGAEARGPSEPGPISGRGGGAGCGRLGAPTPVVEAGREGAGEVGGASAGGDSVAGLGAPTGAGDDKLGGGVGVEGGGGGFDSSGFSRRRRRNSATILGNERPTLLTIRRDAARRGFDGSRSYRTMPPTPSARIQELMIELPPPPSPAGAYSPVVVAGSNAWVSGQIATENGRIMHPGLVDSDVPLGLAQQLARRATLQGLSALVAALGSIDRIERVLRVGVYVASSPGFVRQHEVGNGATELLISVFGEVGRPARVSMGVTALPLGGPVEVELAVQVR